MNSNEISSQQSSSIFEENCPNPEINSLHNHIKHGDINEVKRIIRAYQTEKYFYNGSDESAAAAAMENNQIEIYECLLLHGIYFGHHEDVEKIVEKLSNESKELFRCLHKKYEKDVNCDYWMILLAKSKLSHNTEDKKRRKLFEKIVESLATLNKIEWIVPVLEIVAYSRNLVITFDFSHDSVEHMDPRANKSVEGLCYHQKGHIYIGAQGLLEDEFSDKYHDTLGVIAHEMSHYAMQLTFVNNCRPYLAEEDEKMTIFEKVLTLTKGKSDSEPHVEIVYCYPEKHQVAELIVRVPHLLAKYFRKSVELNLCKEKFSELFQFYEKNTLIDLKLKIPFMEAEHKLKETNDLCGTLAKLTTSDIQLTPESLNINLNAEQEILLISSNCSQLTLNAIYQQIRDDVSFESSYIFANSETFKDEKNFDLIVKALKLCTEPVLIIIDQEKDDMVTEILKKLMDKGVNRSVVFVTDKIRDLLGCSSFELKHSWSNLTSNFQQNLLQRKVDFHGKEIAFGDLIKDPSAMEYIPFKYLLENRKIKIGRVETFKDYVDRKFLTPDSKISLIFQFPVPWPYEDYDKEHDFEAVLEFAEKHQTILLYDEPGNGKSTSFKIIQSKLKEKYSTHWIVFMDLKEHCGVFQADSKITIEFKSVAKVVEFFCDKILKIKCFEAQIFSQLFNEDRVIVLMDGLDEVCPSYKKFIFGLLIAIQTLSKNQLWISMRPHLVNELTNILHPTAFKLKPFTRKNRQEFFRKFFIAKDKDDENIESKLIEIEKLLEDLLQKSWHSISNPLLFKMIAECFDDDEDFKLSSANLFSIYDQFTTKMIERSMEKGPQVRKSIARALNKSNTVEFYLKNSFRICFYDENLEVAVKEMIDLCFGHVSTPSSDDISRVGLIFSEDSDNFRFIHRTFAEFYIAQFFHKTIFLGEFRSKDELEAVAKVFIEVLNSTLSYNMVIAFLDHALESFKSDENLILTKSAIENVFTRKDLHFPQPLIKCGYLNVIKALTTFSHPEFLLSKDSHGQNLIMTAVSQQSIEFIEPFFDFFERTVDSRDVQRTLLERNDDNRNVFHLAVIQQKSEVFSFLLSKSDGEDLLDLLMQNDKNGDSVVKCALSFFKAYENLFEMLSQKLNQTQLQILLKSGKNGEFILHSALHPIYFDSIKFDFLWDFMKQNFDTEALQDILMQRNANNFTLFEIALRSGEEVRNKVTEAYIEIFDKAQMLKFALNIAKNVISADYYGRLEIFTVLETLFEDSHDKSNLKNILMTKNNDGETLLTLAARNHAGNIFSSLLSFVSTVFNDDELREILLQANNEGKCAFHCAVQNDDDKVLCSLKILYQDKFDQRKLSQIVTAGGHEFLFNFIDKQIFNNESDIKEFCEYLKDLFNNSEEEAKFKDMLYACGEENETIFMRAIKLNNKKVFETFLILIETFFGFEEVKKILLLKDSQELTAFHQSILNELSSTFEFVKNAYHETLGREEMQRIILKDFKVVGIRDFCVRNCTWRNLATFQIFCDYLKELFEVNEKHKTVSDSCNRERLKFIFLELNVEGDTQLMSIARNYGVQTLNAILSLMTVFEDQEQKEILLKVNDSNECAFHCAAQNIFHNTFTQVKKLYKTKFDAQMFSELVASGDENFNFKFVATADANNYDEIEEFSNRYVGFFRVTKKVKELKSLFRSPIFDGETIFMRAIRLESRSVFETVNVISRKLFDSKTIRKILLEKNSDEETAFHLAIRRDDKMYFECVAEVYLEMLGGENLKDLLFTAIDGGNTAFYALEKMSHSIDAFFQFLNILFIEDEAKFQDLVLSKNQNEKIFITTFREKFPQSLVEKTLKTLEQAFPLIYELNEDSNKCLD